MMSQKEELLMTPAFELKQMIENKTISCLELTDIFLKKIEEKNPSLNAFLYVDQKGARDYAKKVDALVAEGKESKPLLGIPSVVPDVLHMKNTPTTFGSLLFKDSFSEEDAVEITSLKKAGTVILGKTNVAEFGLSYDTINRLTDPCRNPWNLQYSPGGGSGGISSAVAMGLAPVALGTDFNGALRMTSSFCGLPAIMPTRGRVPNVRKHLLPYTERMYYRKGVNARCIRDLAMMLNVLAQPDIRDPICCCDVHRDFENYLHEPPGKLRIAWSSHLDFLPVEQEVLEAVVQGATQLEVLGHTVEEVNLGLDQDLLAYFQYSFAADRYALVMKFLHNSPADFSLLTDYVKKWLKLGHEVTGVQYSMAVTYRGMLEEKIHEVLKSYDLILTPTVPVAPFPIGNPPKAINGHSVKPYIGLWGFLLPFNMSGHPAMTIPCGTSRQGLPIGMQLIGRFFSEGQLLSLAQTYELAHPFPVIRPS